ncbi:hypothetical protein C9439_03320 [archaeon SCG-AAA382B04]|nr:hypothetical protein C9439_03320 [archaeon SCG-AAA382B04]
MANSPERYLGLVEKANEIAKNGEGTYSLTYHGKLNLSVKSVNPSFSSDLFNCSEVREEGVEIKSFYFADKAQAPDPGGVSPQFGNWDSVAYYYEIHNLTEKGRKC